MHNVEASVVTLAMCDDTNTTHVATTSRHGNHASIEPNEIADLASRQINLDRIVDLDSWVGVADSATGKSVSTYPSNAPKLDPTTE